jgi:MFS transporter, PPP family, 3-phenylpropionic acid transporter
LLNHSTVQLLKSNRLSGWLQSLLTKTRFTLVLNALSTFFFTYFAFVGAVNPYFVLWLQDSGFSAGQIGLMMALPPALRLIGPTSWGRLADATGKRVKWLRLMAHLSAVGLLMIALAPHGGAWRMPLALLGLTVMHVMLSGQVPLTESLLLQKLGANTHFYGRVRLFGSLGFIVAVMALGPLLDWLGTRWLLPLGALVLVAHTANSWRLQDAAPAATAATQCANGPVAIDKRHAAPEQAISLLALLRLPHVPLFFAASFLMVFGHMALYIYFSLYLEMAGYSKTIIGFLWVMSTVGEVAYFWWQGRSGGQPLRGYTRSYWAAVLRFGAMAGVAIPLGSPLWLLVALQLLHTFTFATHHAASMVLVKQLFPACAGSTANALFNTVTYGLAGTCGALACAALWGSFGADGAGGTGGVGRAQAVFAMSAAVCGLGGVLAWRLRSQLAVPNSHPAPTSQASANEPLDAAHLATVKQGGRF